MRAHLRVCPEIRKMREAPARVVDIGGKRIVAGHPDTVARYFREKGD